MLEMMLRRRWGVKCIAGKWHVVFGDDYWNAQPYQNTGKDTPEEALVAADKWFQEHRDVRNLEEVDTGRGKEPNCHV